MKIVNRILVTGCVTGTLLLSGVAAFAQEAPKPAKGKEMTMTGCLTKGSDVPQHFTFVDQKSGRKYTVTGQPDLEKHSANHTVTITGSTTAKVFNVTKLEHVSETCQAKGGAERGGAAEKGTAAEKPKTK
jgi:hypothetical protein